MGEECAVETLLGTAGIEYREARMLLAHASGVPEASLAAFPERTVEAHAAERFRAWAQRRREGEPFAYITGWREFYGRDFKVTPAVLIPRPETELLVERAIECARGLRPPRILDLGTGSGAIAVTLACELPQARITAIDTSGSALEVAAFNGKALAPGRIEFLASDWFAGLRGRAFDLIAANPPYITAGDPHLARGDLRFEPPAALVGGFDGMQCIEAIVVAAPRHLAPSGWLLLEHGFEQGAQVRACLAAAGFESIETWRDLAGLDRVSGGKRTTG